MAAYDFPNSPQIGDRVVIGTQTREWSGVVWSLVPTITTGPSGYTGSVGFAGSQGIIGFTGSRGSQGIQGIQGFGGSQGIQGFAGSAGFTGSVGATGFNGSVGFVGSQGTPGTNGGNGTNGFAGSQGTIGFTGSVGFNGSIGATGFTGSVGATGFTGSFGATGFIGSKGFDGSRGFNGSVGATGFNGSVGFTGSIGATGFNGSIGFNGSQGPAGNFGGATFDYTFDTATTNADPGVGKLRLNNANVTLATQLYIDDQNDSSTDIQSFLRTIDDSTSTLKGHFRISNKLDASDFAIFTITSIVEETGHFTVNSAYVTGSATAFSNNEDVIITFARTGDIGATGFTGSFGATGFNGSFGATGFTGSIGFTGSFGNTGFVGSQGVAGPIAGTDGQIIYNNGGVSGGANVYYDDVNQRIGVGISTPTAKLDVNGDITGTILKSTVAVGTAPLTVTSTTRVSNLNVATAGTADVLTTARTINGVSFNGSANITIASNTTNTLTIGTGLSGTSFNGSAAVTIAIDSTVATLTGSQILTNKTISGASNTLSNIANASLTNSSVTVGTTAIALGASSTTLAGLTSVTSTTFVGALTGNASTATTLQTARTITLTGDVTGVSGGFDGSGNLSFATTIAANSVALGTDTTGNYVAGATAGTGIAITGTAGEGWSPTISLLASDLTLFPTSNFKKSVRVATTANITLSAPQTIDGIAVVAGNRVLVKNQTTSSQNGIYIVAAGAWTRSVAADGSTEIDSAVVGIDEGTVNGGLFYTNTFKSTDVVGTTAMPWYKVTTELDNLTAGSSSVGTVTYSGTTNAVGQFNGGTTTPDGSTRLNYSGYFYPTFINLTGSTDTTTAASHYFIEQSSDGFVRPKTLANVKTELVTTAAVNSAAATTLGTVTSGTWNATAITDTYLATISTAGKVSNSATTATNLNTASTIVARDASGNFTAGTITAALTGNASTATTLQTARTINGVSFNGSANITIASNTTNTLTIGTGLSGTSFNGSAAVTIALATGYGDTLNPYASKTANFVLAAPNGVAGVPTFRAIVAADIPTLNQNTTGTAANVTGIVAVANGGTGVTTSTGTGSVVLSASPTFTGTISAASLTLSGDLTINGTTTTVNSTTLTVDDKNIELGSVTTPTNATADGGGITLKGTTDKTFNWVSATGAWTSSENIALAAGKDIILNGLTSGSVTLVVPDVSGTNTVTVPAITGTVITTGDTGTVTNTMLAGSIANAKLTNSSITVGTTVIALGASSTTLAGLTSVTSTGFTGALTGNASTATSAATLTTARNINGVSFNGSADITITAANPNALTIGTGLSGTSYNGSSAVTIALAAAHGDTTNPYASKTANFFLAAPNGAAGVPTFRAIVAADIPTLNQNTTGSAGSAPAGTLTGTILNATVVTSSLTSVGTITSGTWSGSFGAVSGANLTSLTAGNLSGTIPSAVLGNSVHFIGTTSIALNRASAAQTLTGVSIDGTAGGETLATVTNRGAATTSSIYLPSGEGTAYGFWGGTTTYSIAMGTTAGTYQYGPVTDYSIKTNMAGGAGRGFTWGQFGVKPIAALNSTSGDMQIAGTFSAASKSFLIPHPTKEGKQLRHGSLEGPENGVYIRGKLKDDNTIELPEYWTKLIDPDSITVSLTSIGKHQDLYVESVDINKVIIGNGNLINRSINCFFVVYGERIDIAKLVVESD